MKHKLHILLEDSVEVLCGAPPDESREEEDAMPIDEYMKSGMKEWLIDNEEPCSVCVELFPVVVL